MYKWQNHLLRAFVSALSAFFVASTLSFVIQKLHVALVMKGLKVHEEAFLYNIPDFVVDSVILFILFFGITFVVIFCFAWNYSAKVFHASA